MSLTEQKTSVALVLFVSVLTAGGLALLAWGVDETADLHIDGIV